MITIFKVVVSLILIIASVYDIKTKGERVPNYLTGLIMCTAFLNPNFNLVNSVLGFLCGLAIFLGACGINSLVCILQKKPPTLGYGGADIKLAAGYGFAVGAWDVVLLASTIAVWGSLLTHIIFWLGSAVFKLPKRDPEKPILFVPYIATGSIICLLLI